jgi:hypothetical protein
MKCKFVELHSVLFHCGKNHGLKLLANADLSLDYDQKEKELKVTYKGEPTFLPSTSVHNYTPFTEADVRAPVAPIVNVSHDQDVRKIKSAQVSGPHDHVFQGEGAGKRRDK